MFTHLYMFITLPPPHHIRVLALLLHNLELTLPAPRKRIFPVLPNPQQLLHVLLVNSIQVLRIRVLGLHDGNRTAHNDIDGAAVGHETYVVVEDACFIHVSTPVMFWM